MLDPWDRPARLEDTPPPTPHSPTELSYFLRAAPGHESSFHIPLLPCFSTELTPGFLRVSLLQSVLVWHCSWGEWVRQPPSHNVAVLNKWLRESTSPKAGTWLTFIPRILSSGCAGFSLSAWDMMVSKAHRDNVTPTCLARLPEPHC